MNNWSPYELNSCLMKGLQALGFIEPTPIQERLLVEAIGNKRDILGTAKTGSGKTLAYGIPILNRIAQDRETALKEQPDLSKLQRNRIYALVLVPTRELGLQVVAHLKQAASFIPKIRIVSIIGGMSVEKQQRELSIHPDIVVATPGRLWELLESEGLGQLPFLLAGINFFVIDEADRMVENGHLKSWIRFWAHYIYSTTATATATGTPGTKSNFNLPKESSKGNIKNTTCAPKIRFQTFIFSATLSLKRETEKGTVIDPMEGLLNRLVFCGGHRPSCINLVEQSDSVVPESLREYKITIPKEEKDLFLVYLLLINQQYSLGKVLVFMNSIDGIRRIIPLLKNLNICAVPLHSQMQQRQRLNNIDKFHSTLNSVLVASDVAARGLDIPQVSTVIHYQLPLQSDLYVHRSGRTARANESGISIALVGEEDFLHYKRVLSKLNKKDLSKIPDLNLNLMYKLKPMMKTAKRIDTIEHSIGKTNANNHWMQEAADMLGVEMDQGIIKNIDDDGKLRTEAQTLKQQLELQIIAFRELMSRNEICHPLIVGKNI